MSVTAVSLQPVKSSVKVWLWIGVIAAILGAFGLAWVGTRPVVAQHLPADQDAKFLEWHKSQPGVKTTASGLQYMLIRSGKGDTAKDGDGVILSIEGRYRDGTVFQPKSSDQWLVGQRDPQSGKLTRIEGYGEAVKLMNKGSAYRFWIPTNLAYGETPPDPRVRKNAALVFDIEVVEQIGAAEIKAMQEQQAMQQQMMQQMQQQQGAAPEGAPKAGEPRQ
jgi:hypothetical protein